MRALHRRQHFGRHRPHLGAPNSARAARSTTPSPSGRAAKSSIGNTTAEACASRCSSAAEIHTHQFEVYLCAQASDLQGIPAAYGASITRRRKGTPVHAVADGVVTFKGWGRRRVATRSKIKHAGNLMTGLPAPERLCQGHLEGLARFAGGS